MTRHMYDSLNPEAIPQGSPLVASYIDGENAPAPGWESRFTGAQVVTIARIPTTDAGDVLDAGDNGVTPQQAVGWVKLRRAAGASPTVYINAAAWAQLRAAFVAAGESEPDYWVAQWDGVPVIPTGAVAKQYADSRMTGGDYDVSEVADDWPRAVAPPAPAPAPVPDGPTYTVQPGDTLWGIAQAYRMTLAELESLNQQAGHPPGNFSLIQPGDIIRVSADTTEPTPAPEGRIVTVQRGDSMWSIAQRYGVSLAELEAANPTAGHPAGDFSVIWPGDELRIP